MRYSIRTVTPASELPFPLEEAKAHLRVDSSDEDALIEAQLWAAVDHIERHTSQVLSPRVMEMVLGAFPCTPELISIPRAPVTEIVSISYTDAGGSPVVLAADEWRWSDVEPELVMPAFRAAWPAAADERGSVRVRFAAGYEAGLVPASLVAAVKLMLGQLYQNREGAAEMPAAVAALCRPYRRIVI